MSSGKSQGDRDGASDVQPYGIWFALQMQPLEDVNGDTIEPSDTKWEDIGFFFIRDRSEKAKNYSISIGNLPYKKWYVRLFPHIATPNGVSASDVARLDTNGFLQEIPARTLSNDFLSKITNSEKFNIPIPGEHSGENLSFNITKTGTDTGGVIALGDVKVVSEFQDLLSGAGFISGNRAADSAKDFFLGGGQDEISFMDETLRENYDKRVASSDQGAPFKLLTVSETTYPEQVGADTTYSGICVLGAEIRTSDRMTASPDLSMFVNEGRVIRNYIASGVHQGEVGQRITNFADDFSIPEIVGGVTFAYNLDTTGINQVGTTENANNLNTPLVDFRPGDRYVLFNLMSSNYFPDIYVDMLINPEGGLGGLINAEDFIDFDSIVEANKFVKESNFFYDGVITDQEQFASWATEAAALSRLVPAKIEGRFGLVIEKPNLPVEAIFNESNIIKDSYEEEYVPWQENSVNQVVLTYTNGADIQRPITAVTARTPALNSGSERLVTYNIEGLSVSNTAQAISVAATVLNSKRLQVKAVRFSTALQGLFLKPGSRIIVQHQINEFDFEVSGYVTNINAFDEINKTQSFLLSRSYVAPADVGDYRATIQLQSNGEVYENLEFTIEQISGTPYIKFADQSIPSTISIGDPVMISRVTTEDRNYRVQSVSRDSESAISINAIYWTEEIFNYDDIEIIVE